jgi:hypothetical protein
VVHFQGNGYPEACWQMAHLGEGAPWSCRIFILPAFALKQNKEFLLACSSNFVK